MVVMNSGSAEFNGLENPDAEVEMEIFAAANNSSGTYVVKPAGNTTIRQLLTKMKGQDGRQLWQYLYKSWSALWTGSFLGKDKTCLSFQCRIPGQSD